MRTLFGMLAALATLAMIAAPLANAGTAAQPITHMFYGFSAQDSQIHVDSNGVTVDSSLNSAVVGACADVTPVASSLTPLTIFRDGVQEEGVGGGCFAFQTVYGDDTGHTVRVLSQDLIGSISTVYVSCVDENGDGLCSADLGDQYVLCENGNLLNSSSACTVYEDPAALNPNVFVLVLGGISADGSVVSPTDAVGGYLFLSYS